MSTRTCEFFFFVCVLYERTRYTHTYLLGKLSPSPYGESDHFEGNKNQFRSTSHTNLYSHQFANVFHRLAIENDIAVCI